jgi:hypothetical protein
MKGAMTATPPALEDAQSDPSLASDPKPHMPLVYIGDGAETGRASGTFGWLYTERIDIFKFVYGAVPPV